jgi:hypothetical protein
MEFWSTGFSSSVGWDAENHLFQIIVEILKFVSKLGQGQGHLHNNILICWLSWEVSGEERSMQESYKTGIALYQWIFCVMCQNIKKVEESRLGPQP